MNNLEVLATASDSKWPHVTTLGVTLQEKYRLDMPPTATNYRLTRDTLCPLSAFAFSMTVVKGSKTDLKSLLGNILLPQFNLMVQNKMGMCVGGVVTIFMERLDYKFCD